MDVPPEEGMGALRFSLGRATTEAEIREVAERLDRALAASTGASYRRRKMLANRTASTASVIAV